MAEGSTVLVSNISPQLEEHHLKELFECCGAITSLQLNKALGQCQVSFADSTHARAAVFLSGTTLGDRPLTVSAYQPPPPRQLPPQMSPWASGVPPPVGTPGLIPNPYGGAMNPMGGMQADNEKKQQEIARTVYVGNVNCDLTHEQLSDFFHQNCGPTNIVKLAGETTGKPSRFAFIEFCNVDAAGKALLLDGAPLAGLPLKVRKANNAILKPTNTPAAAQPAQKDMSEIMKRVLAHTTNLGAKLEPKRRSRSRDRDRSRRDRSRDRDRDRSRRRRRSSRSRSRSRDRSRRDRGGDRGGDRRNDDRRCYNCGESGHISRNCTKSRSRSPGRRAGGGAKKAATDDHAGMFFNGYKWEPIESLSNPAGALPGPGGAPQALPLGGVRASLIQQQQAMAMLAQQGGAPPPPQY